MSSICVKEESASRLLLSMEPTAATWAVAFGIFSLVIGCPLYNYDCICMVLLVWVLGTAALLAFFNPWQEVILDKEKLSLVINRQNFFQRYNMKTSTPAIYEFSNILNVKSEYSSIVFTFANFETVELNVKEDICKLAQLVEKIKGILQLDESQTSLGNLSSESENGSHHAEAGNEDGSSATSDESFERIDSADLADYEDTKAALENDIPSEDIQSLSPSSEEPKDLKSSEWEEQNAPLESTPVSVDQQEPESTSESVVHSATELKP